jgi:hypothetical protein
MKTSKHLLSFIVVVVFFLFAVGSKVSTLPATSFYQNNKVETPEEKDVYLEQNDGTKIYGKKVEYTNGLLLKKQIKIDKQPFKIAEIRGYRMGDFYYGRRGNEYIKRIVHGKINVYIELTFETNTSTDSHGAIHSHSYTKTEHYYQEGETGELKALASMADIKRVVSACPLAVQMLDISSSQLRKLTKKNASYLNSVFETYNNDCKFLVK